MGLSERSALQMSPRATPAQIQTPASASAAQLRPDRELTPPLQTRTRCPFSRLSPPPRRRFVHDPHPTSHHPARRSPHTYSPNSSISKPPASLRLRHPRAAASAASPSSPAAPPAPQRGRNASLSPVPVPVLACHDYAPRARCPGAARVPSPSTARDAERARPPTLAGAKDVPDAGRGVAPQGTHGDEGGEGHARGMAGAEEAAGRVGHPGTRMMLQENDGAGTRSAARYVIGQPEGVRRRGRMT
ncbi:hypothetical protein C8R44DRAFT_731234 [Mycena epipterygia]|nr:hypothetical protein C8R44DRAFT_731234 [Mycena epipterygia]